MKYCKYLTTLLFILLCLSISACGGGSSGGDDSGGGSSSSGSSSGGSSGSGSGSSGGSSGGDPDPDPADRFVISGNSDGTLSILRVDPVAGFATSVGFVNLSGLTTIRDMFYDVDNQRLIVLDSQNIHTLSTDVDSGNMGLIDSETTSTSSNSHLVVSDDRSTAYVASGSGTEKFIDVFSIDSAGMLTTLENVTSAIDPDYIQLNPGSEQVYLVSRSDDSIEIYDVNSDGSLVSGPATFNTDENPTALIFHDTVNVAYLLRADNSDDSLEVLNVDPTTGALSSSGSSFDVDTSANDLVLSSDGAHLYIIESSNDEVHHYTVDTSNGALSFVASHNLSFTPTDLQLSQTGAELYISHSEDDLVSTIAVNSSDGTLEIMDWTRVFDSANSVAAISGPGALTPTPTFLLAPDRTGLSRYSIDENGALTLEDKESNAEALISGQVAFEPINQLLFGAGEDATANEQDFVTAYSFNPSTGATVLADDFVGSLDTLSDFERLVTGRSGRFIYVQDQGSFSTNPTLDGSIRAYAFDDAGNITQFPVDTQTTGEGPESLRLAPNGRYIYSVNSFDDDVRWYEISESDGSISGGGTTQPGGSGLGAGRPIDIAFHPNGRFAYVSIQDESEVGRYQVDENGNLNNISRFNTATSNSGTETDPTALAIHPNGLYLFAVERNSSGDILVMSIDPEASYSLSFVQRLSVTGNPTWVEINPAGDSLYVRYSDESIEVFDFDVSSETLSSTGQTVDAGDDGGFLGSLTLIAPLQVAE